MKEFCETCRFYFDSSGKGPWRDGHGKCRRYPEHIETNESRWCGEYQAAPAEST